MILKYKLNDSYKFIDNITVFTINERDNPIAPTTMHVGIERKFGGGDGFGLMLSDKAYLMNDTGQTIEKLI